MKLVERSYAHFGSFLRHTSTCATFLYFEFTTECWLVDCLDALIEFLAYTFKQGLLQSMQASMAASKKSELTGHCFLVELSIPAFLSTVYS